MGFFICAFGHNYMGPPSFVALDTSDFLQIFLGSRPGQQLVIFRPFNPIFNSACGYDFYNIDFGNYAALWLCWSGFFYFKFMSTFGANYCANWIKRITLWTAFAWNDAFFCPRFSV